MKTTEEIINYLKERLKQYKEPERCNCCNQLLGGPFNLQVVEDNYSLGTKDTLKSILYFIEHKEENK